jgi:hypothetical protein
MHLDRVSVLIATCSFSEDIQTVDRDLPTAILSLATRSCTPNLRLLTDADVCTEIFKLIVQLLIFFSTCPSLAFTIPCYALIVFATQKVYVHASKQLRRRELNSKAAITTSFIEIVCCNSPMAHESSRADWISRPTASTPSEPLAGSQRPSSIISMS